ncbi:unnamed protein product [Caenorhabditis bovis]|uniref:Acyl-CoA dehydrogenase/oxidase C-terminal domain-containing protein n=1 Tax=Caenorhabditis bovis TaxID=2654633 RepID=A0A8S1F2C6_9PELO|nr:unnamed protein product [Caenorhabditis bovis]
MQRILSRTNKRAFIRALSDSANKPVAKNADKPRFAIRNLDPTAPVEKLSLSRGLALNKFEKDFMIYPEYLDSDDVRNIEGFVDILRNSLKLACDSAEIEKAGELTPEVLDAMKSNAIFGLSIGKDFNGVGMNNKDVSKVFEELSVDLNVFTTAQIALMVAKILTIYGSDEQKSKFLPLLASSKCRAAIAFSKNIGAKLTMASVGKSMITGENVRVVGQHNANFFLVFADSPNKSTRQIEQTCYILNEPDFESTDSLKFERDSTLGLKAVDVGKITFTALITPENVLGDAGNGPEVGSELVCSGRITFAAGVVGIARRALRDLSIWCNRAPSRNTSRATLADDFSAQRIVTDAALKVYALESALYYIAGMVDEGLAVVIDIENALLSILSKEVIQSIISVQLELIGMAASEQGSPQEKLIRDATTLLSVMDDGVEVDQIALATISTWATSSSHKRITSTLKRWLTNEKEAEELRNPGLTHYIAEHAHPSLQLACQELEFSMSRINVVISKLLKSQGKNVEQDYGTHEAIVKVLKNNLMMISTISRASRSYSIGLRNADIELAWATMICSRLARETWFELDALSDVFGLVKMNPSLLNAGRAVFDLGGYPIESPLEKNW